MHPYTEGNTNAPSSSGSTSRSFATLPAESFQHLNISIWVYHLKINERSLSTHRINPTLRRSLVGITNCRVHL